MMYFWSSKKVKGYHRYDKMFSSTMTCIVPKYSTLNNTQMLPKANSAPSTSANKLSVRITVYEFTDTCSLRISRTVFGIGSGLWVK